MMEKAHLLIVDDNVSVLNSLELFLSQHFRMIQTLKNPNQLDAILRKEHFDLILLDMNFRASQNTGNEGIFWLRKIHEIDESVAVVFITAYGNIGLAVEAIREGASDFVLKPWDNKKLLVTLQNTLRLKFSREEIRRLKDHRHILTRDMDKEMEFIIEGSEKMKELDGMISTVANTDASILITGENGTGKEVVAREIHKRSQRKNSGFIRVDLGSLTESLFESELFGHVKGAFTDAHENRTGRFELASGGTLFLDEIGNLSLAMQAKLLSAIENKKITPAGSNREIPVDVRLVTASNKDLRQMVEIGSFREDLFYRLNTISIEVPPLRIRGKSIHILARIFLKKYSVKYDKKGLGFHQHAVEKLLSYTWPGNVRELMHTIEKAVILSNQEMITAEDLALKEKEEVTPAPFADLSLEEGERQIIKQTLEKHKRNISETAAALKIGRQTLYRKIEKYGL
jgi:DNA-binding NtrC family response regulator